LGRAAGVEEDEMRGLIAVLLLRGGFISPSPSLSLSHQVGMAPLTVTATIRATRGSYVCVKMSWDELESTLSCFPMRAAQESRKYIFSEGTFRVWVQEQKPNGSLEMSPPLSLEVR
jgi:hypothetical protein